MPSDLNSGSNRTASPSAANAGKICAPTVLETDEIFGARISQPRKGPIGLAQKSKKKQEPRPTHHIHGEWRWTPKQNSFPGTALRDRPLKLPRRSNSRQTRGFLDSENLHELRIALGPQHYKPPSAASEIPRRESQGVSESQATEIPPTPIKSPA